MKIGLFGGTFDPIHNGHLIIAEWVREELQLEKIIFIPAGDPPHKQENNITSIKHRLAMVSLAIEANERFYLSDIEAKKAGKSYTVETLRTLQNHFSSQTKLFWIIGSDSLLDLPNWFQPDEIVRLAQIVVYPRPGYSVNEAVARFKDRVLYVDSPLIDISSTLIRDRIRREKSVRYFLPESVLNYIRRENLYCSQSRHLT